MLRIANLFDTNIRKFCPECLDCVNHKEKHSVHPPPLSAGGRLSLQPKFPKGERLDRASTFTGTLLGKRGVTFFRGRGAIFT